MREYSRFFTLTEHLQQLREIRRQGHLEANTRTCDGMNKAQNRGMQGLSPEGRQSHRCLRTQRALRQLSTPAINRITDQAVPGMGQMNPDLMGAPGFQPALYLRQHKGRTIARHDASTRHRVATALEKNGLALTVRLVARQLRGQLQHIARLE